MALQVSNSVRVCDVSESGIDLQTGVSIFSSHSLFRKCTSNHARDCIALHNQIRSSNPFKLKTPPLSTTSTDSPLPSLKQQMNTNPICLSPDCKVHQDTLQRLISTEYGCPGAQLRVLWLLREVRSKHVLLTCHLWPVPSVSTIT